MYHPSYVIVGERLSKYCAYIHPLQTIEHELAFHSFFFVLSFITLYVPVHSPHEGSSLQAPLCPPPRPVPRRYKAYQGIHTGKSKESAKESRPHIRLLFCRGHERGSGKEERLLPCPAPGSSASTLLSSSLSFLEFALRHLALCGFLSRGLGPAFPRPRRRGSPRSAGFSARRQRGPGS